MTKANTKKKTMTKALSVGVLVGVAALNVEGGDNKALLDKLVEKGSITRAEADALLRESNDEYNNALPSWVNSLTLKGDLRLRYDHTYDSASNGRSAEDRVRYRFRFGGVADLKNNFKMGFRMATGHNMTSSNQTFSNDFTRDDFGLDQAYIGWQQEGDWEENSGFTIYAGKNPNFEKTGWKLSKALFDSDISPEGFEAHYGVEIGSTTLGLHGGAYFLEGEDDPGKQMSKLIMGQVTTSTALSDTLRMDLGLGAYGIDSSDLTGPGTGHGNTVGQGYTPLMLDAAFTYRGASNPIKLYGTWIDNQQADTLSTGYITGIKYGSAKKAGQWEAKIEYRSFEADAFWDEFAESEFGAIGVKAANEYAVGTNTEGLVIQGKYNIYSNIQVVLAWRHTEAETSVYDDESNNFFQADLIFKF